MKIYNILLPSLLSINLIGQNLELADDRKTILEYSYEKIKQDSSKLKTDWINSLTYTYSQLDGDTTSKNQERKSIISISQPIFKSGGIYSSIKYASAINKLNTISITLEEKELIKNTTTILFNIHKTNLLIEKQKLILSNSLIDIEQKRENVLNGLLDISFLNNAMLEHNKQKELLLELEFQLESLTNNFQNFTAKTPENFNLPILKLFNSYSYLENNIYIKQSKSNSETKEHLKGMVRSKYLPTLNANYNYTENHTTNNNSNTYGFNVVIPLNFGLFNDISSSKIDFLKSKYQETVTARTEKNFLKTSLAKINMLDKKIELTKQNIKSFEKLLVQMQELKIAGLKTKNDVLILQNSKLAETLNTKIFSIDRQLELLELYSRVENEI